jgi:CRISPR/Cas system CSM-associated protein Csm3 (group 7 of RAMP superfamily)
MMHLKIAIQSYWHPGTGRGRGSHLDATTHRNADDLPSLPGRTLKGLVRDAVYRWERFGGYGTQQDDTPSVTEQLFGPYSQNGMTWPGLLRFSDAQLSPAEVAHLVAQPRLRAGLYRSHFATAIEHATGTADEHALRGIELVIPLTLYASLDLVPNAPYRGLETRWPALLAQALPLVRAVGAHRSRGLGRAVVTLEDPT